MMGAGRSGGPEPEVRDQRSVGKADIDPNAVYSLGSSSIESERLQRQADELAPDSEAVLGHLLLLPVRRFDERSLCDASERALSAGWFHEVRRHGAGGGR